MLGLTCGFALVGGLGPAAGPLAAQAAEGPCETDARYRALDFLLGEWRLVSGGETVGRSRVEKLEDGCLIRETWSLAAGRSGRTYSAFDPVAGTWRRFSVSNDGVIVRSDGQVDGADVVIEGLTVGADEESASWRERLTRMADGRVAWIAGGAGASERAGRSRAARFERHYVPAGDLEPPSARPDRAVETAAVPASAADPPVRASADAPAAAPEESASPPVRASADVPAVPESASPPVRASADVPAVPESASPPAASVTPAVAPAAGDVTPGSDRAVDAAAIERIAMASPMVLRVPLGAVESLREGYAWITRDTSPYLCEGVTIESVQVERRARRGRVHLDVEVALHGLRVSRRATVGIDLQRGGSPADAAAVASGAVAGRVGRSIPEQIEHGAVAFELPLSLDAAAFDELVAHAERPELVITLTVGG